MARASTLSVGLDVPKDSLAVAYVATEHGAAVVYGGTIGPRHGDLDKRSRNLQSKATQLLFVYAAGPCGSWLDRELRKSGDDCWGVAPPLMPQKAGARVKTARHDAGQLARLLRSGDLTPVYVPCVEDGAIRDLRRAREDVIRDLKAAPFRLTAFRLRHDIRYTGQATWGPAHLRGLAAGVCSTPAPQIVFQEDVRAVNAPTARRHRLEHARHEPVQPWRLQPVVAALQALRGVQCTVTVAVVAALGDLTRFDTPRQLRRYLGLTPSEYSRGERRRQGSVTKTGNPHARRARVEGAWAYRYPAKVSRHLQLRLEKRPKAAQDISWQAPVRRCKHSRKLRARGQHATQAVGASARALSAGMWALAKAGPGLP